MVTKNELSQDEWNWLLKIYKRNAAMLTVSMDKRLKQLGLIEEKLGGAGVSAEGKKLIERELIAARRAREGQ